MHGNSKPLFDILARVMWRTEKKDVLDQVEIAFCGSTLDFFIRFENLKVCEALSVRKISGHVEVTLN